MTSSINPNIPVNNTEIDAPPIQGNFQAAYNDINSLQGNIVTLQAQIAAIVGGGSFASVLTYFINGINIRVACQQAVNAVAALGGGAVYLPPGTYTGWDCSVPLILPSNIVFYGVKSQSIIIPNMATVVPDLLGGRATGAMIMTGNPTTGLRAGQTSGQSVNSSTCVSNVYISGITIDNSSYSGAHLPVGSHLSGIQLWFAFNCGIVDCAAYNLPNTGLYIFGCRHMKMIGNYIAGNGFLTSEAGTLNGISLRGWIDSVSVNLSAVDYICANNSSNYNFQEGLQSDTVQGLIIANNEFIGNHEYGIEGEAIVPGSTDTSATYGYEVPADVMITGNYINGLDTIAGTTGISGIRWASGNQGRITITGNTVRHIDNSGGTRQTYNGAVPVAFTSGSGIQVSQVNNGTAIVSTNLIDNVIPGTTGAVVYMDVDVMHASGNTVSNCSGANFFSINSSNSFTSLHINGNIVDGSLSRLAFIACDAGTSGTAAPSNIVISNNVGSGFTRAGIAFNFPHPATPARISIHGNDLKSVNSTSNASDGFVRFSGGSPTYSLTLTELDITNNTASFAGTTNNPIMFDTTIATGSITTANISNNQFGSTTNNATVNTPAVITNFYQYSNGFPGQRITYGTAAPSAGSWTRGDMVWHSVPTSGQPAFFGCSVTGTPGTWVHVNYV